MSPEDLIEEMPDAHLLCRDIGHRWKPTHVTRDGSLYKRRMQCTRCKTYRVDRVLPTGDVAARSYQYADGYQLPPKAERTFDEAPQRTDYRRVAVHSLWVKYGKHSVNNGDSNQ